MKKIFLGLFVLLSCSTNKTRYFFESYKVENNKEYITVIVNSNGYESTAQLLLQNNNDFQQIRKTKGLSFRGAELKNLSIDTLITNGKIEYRLLKIGEIID